MIVLLIFFPFIVFGETHLLDNKGLGLETLTNTTGTVSEGDFKQQKISLLGGLGKRFGQQAIGVSIYLGRFSSEGKSTFYGEDSGFEYMGTSKQSASSWNSGLVLGWVHSWESFAFGAGTKFNILKFGAQTRDRTIFYSEATSTNVNWNISTLFPHIPLV